VSAEPGLVAGFGMLSTCAQAFALELQAFSVLPFQQTTDLVEKLRAQKVAFEELIIPTKFTTCSAGAIGSFRNSDEF
jgi:hypothetical protein